MLIKEYFTENGNLFKTNQFNPTIVTAVNRMLKYNYSDKKLVYEEPSEVNEIVEMVLYDNKFKYSTMLNLMDFELPNDFTSKNTVENMKTNTGTVGKVDSSTKTNTGTVVNNKDITKDNTGTVGSDNKNTETNTGTVGSVNKLTVTNNLTDTIKGTDTTTAQPNTVTKSQLGFDSGDMIENEVTSNSINSTAITKDNTNTSTGTVVNAGSDTRTDNTTTVNTGTGTLTNNLKEKVNDKNTQTNDLSEVVGGTSTLTNDLIENTNLKNIDLDVSVKLDMLIKMHDVSVELLFRQITEDLIKNLCFRTWGD